MTPAQLDAMQAQAQARIRAMIQAWESVGQHEHAQHLRRQMWELLREAIKARRG